MGYRSSDNAIVISVRGTVPNSLPNIITDLIASSINYSYYICQNCKVHLGFQIALKDVYP